MVRLTNNEIINAICFISTLCNYTLYSTRGPFDPCPHPPSGRSAPGRCRSPHGQGLPCRWHWSWCATRRSCSWKTGWQAAMKRRSGQTNVPMPAECLLTTGLTLGTVSFGNSLIALLQNKHLTCYLSVGIQIQNIFAFSQTIAVNIHLAVSASLEVLRLLAQHHT